MYNTHTVISILSLLALHCANATDYYVNDGSTTGDVYTTAAGASGNNGTDPSTPKSQIQDTKKKKRPKRYSYSFPFSLKLVDGCVRFKRVTNPLYKPPVE